MGASNTLEPPIAFTTELVDLSVKSLDDIDRLFDRRSEPTTITLPTLNSVYFRSPTAHLGVDLFTEFAFLADGHGRHDEFHTACFTCTVFTIAVLAEMSPFPVAANETVLIEEAHVSKRTASARCSSWSALDSLDLYSGEAYFEFSIQSRDRLIGQERCRYVRRQALRRWQ